MRYALLNKYSIDELEAEVNLALSKNWIIVGRAFYRDGKWCQTIIKEDVK